MSAGAGFEFFGHTGGTVSEENRSHARIETSVFCTVATPTDGFDANVVNLSLGGAGLLGPHGVAKRGDSVTLMLDRPTEMISLALTATVVRTAIQGEQTMYGLHFEPLPPDIRGQLVMLLRLIAAGKGTGRRAAPRVARRLVITCHSHDSFRAVLNDLSRGGFSVRSTRSMPVGERLQAKFGVDGLPNLLELEGPVVNSVSTGDGYFRLGVQFEGLTEERLKRIGQLVEVLLDVQGGK